jgi:hypothetical protein
MAFQIIGLAACFIAGVMLGNWLIERFSRPHNSIDEQPDSQLIGDVPRIHPELHVSRNNGGTK